ncbi:amidohydrolase [Amycolatopsis rubida]|uniref:Amidohydrolase n=1 Tax=Amycolatopsis rubida TaxID=112413 RepID=A0ABX0C4H8_9PSEU|nr:MULTISPECIES: amidohydrolase family protein [Amycolatopsis]MYW97661.1 amidohydrolase family protein [Amycolatopsis rubida]NEC62646.1 amidohydrolase [Amycolatopsis rubida]OAP21832.1 Amidohydrolase [Amycolatopsis sp. M39]
MSRAQRIDTHQHLVPPRYAKWMGEKGIRPGGIDLPSWSPSAALKFMDGHGIAVGILSLSTPGVYFGDVPEARRWAREVNEYAAEVVADRPDRFGFFATLTLPDVEGALAEAEYALDTLHADGIVLLANNDGRYLGDPGFEPLLQFLHERQATVFVHPGELPGPEVPGIPTFTADFLLDTTRTAISLILSGSMEKYPGIKFILAHAGGFVPSISYRILLTMLNTKNKAQQAWALLDQKHQVPKQLSVLRKFYYDIALSASPSALPSLLEVASPDHITYGSDFPFAPAVAVGFLNKTFERYPLDAGLRAAIDRGNSENLFPRLKG